MGSPAESLGKDSNEAHDPMSDTAIGRAIRLPEAPKPHSHKAANGDAAVNLDPIEALRYQLAGKAGLNRPIQSIDTYAPLGFEGLVETINLHLPNEKLLNKDVLRRFTAERWLPIIEQKPNGDVVIAVSAHDDRDMLRSVDTLSLPIIDRLDVWTKQAGFDKRVVLLLVNGEQFNELSKLVIDNSHRQKYLGHLSSEETARDNFFTVLQRAVKQGATDIHIEPVDGKDFRIRYRIDGVLQHDGRTIPSSRGKALVRAIKVMAKSVNDDARKPWDGSINPEAALLEQFPFLKGRSLRISTMPTLHGEDAAIRILQSAEVSKLRLGDLRLRPTLESRLRRLLEAPNGVLLVAGPTGSGKTTTLAAALRELNNVDTKIVTLEDPVEQLQQGVIQSPMNAELGYNFASALRSTLRHDPDVILVGEVRDPETAQVMTQGANTGHLLLSTIHTNDSISVFKRLRELGIEESQILASLLGVLSQRLVRCLCSGCKEPYNPADELKKILVPADLSLQGDIAKRIDDYSTRLSFWRTGARDKVAACRDCSGRGYKGRVAIPELWVIGEGERDLISRGDTGHKALFKAAVDGGMVPMSIAGLDYVRSGITDVKELLSNVIRPDELISKREMFLAYLEQKSRKKHD